MIPSLSLMVAVIGIVVCLYVITRAGEMLESESSAGVKFFAAVTALAALGAIVIILIAFFDVVTAARSMSGALDVLGR